MHTRYAVVFHISPLTHETKVEVWDEATVALAERYAPNWQVESWHDSKEAAQEAANSEAPSA